MSLNALLHDFRSDEPHATDSRSQGLCYRQALSSHLGEFSGSFHTDMRFSAMPLLAILATVNAATWSFGSAKLEIAGSLHNFEPSSDVVRTSLGPEDNFKLLLTAKEDDLAKKPHQAMLLVKDSGSDLEANLVIPIRSNGRGSLTVTYMDLGTSLIQHKSIDLTLVIGGFGDTAPIIKHIATLQLQEHPSSPIIAAPTSLRYGALPEITHTFRAAEKMPSTIISVVFSLILLAGLVGLFAGWSLLGANVNAMSSSVSKAPISYLVFLGSLFAIEGALFLYWSHLKIMAAVGSILCLSVPAFFSGRIALRETEQRRKAGLR